MTVRELTREQLTQLKLDILEERLRERENRTPSWGEMADVDTLISDEDVIAHFGGVTFQNDDFWCSAGEE